VCAAAFGVALFTDTASGRHFPWRSRGAGRRCRRFFPAEGLVLSFIAIVERARAQRVGEEARDRGEVGNDQE
jgi:hypothetical protein